MPVHDDDAGFQMLTDKITRDRGFRCGSYKDRCLRRRIAVRMRAKGTMDPREYAAVLDTDPREYERLLHSLTVNVTKFFRNWATYSVIESEVIPALWGRDQERLRVWSAGCASGEEAYSVAFVMLCALRLRVIRRTALLVALAACAVLLLGFSPLVSFVAAATGTGWAPTAVLFVGIASFTIASCVSVYAFFATRGIPLSPEGKEPHASHPL